MNGEAFDALVARARAEYGALLGDQGTAVLVGTATCGRSAGAVPVLEAFRAELVAIGADAPVVEVGCLGHCYAEPLAIVKRPGTPALVYHRLTPATARVLTRKTFLEDDPYYDVLLGAREASELFPGLADLPRFAREHRRLLARCGWIDPTDAGHFLATGGYAGLRRALAMAPDEIVAAVRTAGLRGLGGAGFPAWRKWEACRGQAETTRYLICNADEGDPGAFMDRTLLESDPHAVIEGMAIAARAIGAACGYVYVRAEYPLAVRRVRRAIADARALGVLGDDVLGSGTAFDVTVFEGAGAFVCGESSALMRSIEGRRGTPRVRPPQSTEAGLFGKPTVLHNVKSLASVGVVLRNGPEAFASVGTDGSKGTAVFALAGKVAWPGLVEVPMGTTLRDLVFAIGGGVPRRRRFKAVQIGGPSGGCLPESLLDVAIDFDALAHAGSMMGSGGMVVMDQDNCMVEAARYFLDFTQRESCGHCTFCRIGTRHLHDLLVRITSGAAAEGDLAELERLAQEVAAGSMCNLGKTAPSPILTTLRFFRDEYDAHVRERRCDARVCKDFTAYYIVPEKCARGCDACVGSCPPEAIYTTRRRVKAIEQAKCVKCGSCVTACPPEYSAVVKISPVRDLPPSEPRPVEEERG